jgi:hypothetical protein
MNNLETIGRWILILGGSLVVVGAILWLLGLFNIFEHFPGTIRIQTSGITCVFPLLASILISIVLTVVLNIIIRLFNK